MPINWKLTISVLVVGFLLAACAQSNTTPTHLSESSPASMATFEPSGTPIPTRFPSAMATQLPLSSATLTPTNSPTPMGGSGVILFASNRGGSYLDLYLLDIASKQPTRLTNGDSNTFPGPFSPPSLPGRSQSGTDTTGRTVNR